jgi:Heterokaryon incompatibility protein (HET)
MIAWLDADNITSTDAVDDVLDTVPGRLVSALPGSSLSVNRMLNFLNICNQCHDCIERKPTLPTRVVEIVEGNPFDLKVRETNGEVDVYLALSHSKGREQQLTLTTENLEQLKTGLNVEKFPTTIQDAFDVALTCGIRYIWIDSLCILHNDIEDWEREVGRMDDILSNAYFTISATGSNSDSTGCYLPFTRYQPTGPVSAETMSMARRCIPGAAPLYSKEEIDLGFAKGRHFGLSLWGYQILSAKQEYANFDDARLYFTAEWMPSSLKYDARKYGIGFSNSFAIEFDPLHKDPLSQDAWAAQERVLSSRTFHFGVQQMYLECSSIYAEDGMLLSRHFPSITEMIEDIPICEDEDPFTQVRWPDPWLEFVKLYSARKLTRQQDKLPAVAALAKRLAKHSKDTYYAGLWRSNLFSELLWFVDYCEPVSVGDDLVNDPSIPKPWISEPKYPDQYRAPSWSWASLDAKVGYHMLDEDTICVKCLEIDVKPERNDPFMRVKSGIVKLEVTPPTPFLCSFTEVSLGDSLGTTSQAKRT